MEQTLSKRLPSITLEAVPLTSTCPLEAYAPLIIPYSRFQLTFALTADPTMVALTLLMEFKSIYHQVALDAIKINR